MHPTPFCFNFVTLFHLHSHHCPALLTYHYTLHHVFWALIKDHFSLVGMPIYRNFHVYKRFCFFHMAFSKWWYFTLFRSTKHDSLRTINKGPTNQKQRGNEKSQQHQHFVTFFLFSGPVAKKQMFSTTKHPTTLCLSEEFPPSFQLSSWMRSSRLWPPRTSENPPSVSTKVTSEV